MISMNFFEVQNTYTYSKFNRLSKKMMIRIGFLIETL